MSAPGERANPFGSWIPRKGVPRDDLFDINAQLTQQGQAAMGRPLPERRFIVFFTGRSGSSWLSQVMRNAPGFGAPGEMFNPTFVDRDARGLGAHDLDSYCDLIQRDRCIEGTWGVKATPEHALHLFGGIPQMVRRFEGAGLAWLIREDVVAQAVSRYMRGLSKVAHLTPQTEREDLSHIPYDNDAIWYRIEKITEAEREVEAQFAALGLAPIRLSYERNMAAAPEALLERLGELVGVPPRSQEVKSSHRKLGAQKNAEFIAMFKEQNVDALEKVAQERAAMLAALDQQA